MNKTTLLIFALFLLTILFLVGCTTVEKPTTPTPTEEVSLQSFFDAAGCYEVHNFQGSTSIRCTDVELASKFNCRDPLSIPENGMNLGLPLVRCNSPTWSQDGQQMSSEEQENYFKCGGGLLRTCKSYISYKDNDFIQIKNKEELLSYVGAINNKDKALALVLLTEGGSEELIVNEKKISKKNVEVVGQNFLVTVYAEDRVFGCYDEINYEAIKYEVASDGDITEKSREVVYNKQLDAYICVD